MMSIINHAVEIDEILLTNRLRKVEIDKIEPPKQKHLELDVVTKLDVLAKTELETVQYASYLLMRAGFRRGEISALTAEDVVVKADGKVSITINKSMTAKALIKKPKTENSYRTVQFQSYRARIFSNWLKVAEERYKHRNRTIHTEIINITEAKR